MKKLLALMTLIGSFSALAGNSYSLNCSNLEGTIKLKCSTEECYSENSLSSAKITGEYYGSCEISNLKAEKSVVLHEKVKAASWLTNSTEAMIITFDQFCGETSLENGSSMSSMICHKQMIER